MTDCIADAACGGVADLSIGEVVARHGGYEEVARAGLWATVATSLGLAKVHAGEHQQLPKTSFTQTNGVSCAP